MPSWSIHLAIAKKIGKKLNLDMELFSYGNLIPDTDKKCILGRYDAHYYGTFYCPMCKYEMLPDLRKFLINYKKCINDTIILGYYCHLLTDYFYNNYIYSNCWVQSKSGINGIKLKNGDILSIKEDDFKTRKYYKHYDLELYGKMLYESNEVFIPSNIELICSKMNFLSFLNSNDVSQRINYLNSSFDDFNIITEEEKNNGFLLFEKDDYDKMFNECIDFVLDKIKKEI